MIALFETKVGLASDGSWAFAIRDYLTLRCVASEAGFGSRRFALDAADDAKRALARDEGRAA